jgi:mono/diheme cytochrome c family protein
LSQNVFANVGLSFANIVPLLYPIIALVTTVTLYVRAYFVERAFILPRYEKWACAVLLVLMAACAGAFFAGGSSQNSTKTIDSQPIGVDTPIPQNQSRLLWNARCATCHGIKGNFNEKFVREFYPVPPKLDTQRLDSLGEDSLVKVILNGRNNMNAFAGRLTPGEALGLVNYMQSLAKHATESAKEGEE